MSTLSQEAQHTLDGRLPKDWCKIAHKVLGGQFSKSHIYRVKSGEYYNEEIVNVLFKIAQWEDARKEAREKMARGEMTLEEFNLSHGLNQITGQKEQTSACEPGSA